MIRRAFLGAIAVVLIASAPASAQSLGGGLFGPAVPACLSDNLGIVCKSGSWVGRTLSTGLTIDSTTVKVDDSVFTALGPQIGDLAADFANPTTFGTNRVDMGAAEFELPHGSDQTLSELGEMSIDTDANQLVFYGGASVGSTYIKTLDQRLKVRAYVEYPQNGDAILIDKAIHNMIPLQIDCITTPATATVLATIKECTTAGASCAAIHDTAVTCDDDNSTGTTTTFNAAGALIDDGKWIQLSLGTTANSPTSLTIQLEFIAGRQ